MDDRRYSAYCSILAAVAEGQAGRTIAFAELDQRSSQVARALQRKDVRPGDRVAYIGDGGSFDADGFLYLHDRLSFVPSLARTASGKLRKQAIRARLGSVAVP
jgi:acyl-coenzyme A synthetase/AMP-(fatty) acid ligase